MDNKHWAELKQEYQMYIRLEKRLSLNSVEAYMRDLDQFHDFLSSEYSLTPENAEANHLEAFVTSIYERGATKTTQARIISGIRSFYNFMVHTDKIDSSPAAFIDSPKTGRHLPDVLTLDEIDAIINSIDLSHPLGHRNKAMTEVLYSCGLRVSELISLRMSDLFFDDGFIRVSGKGSKQRLVPLSDTARKYIELYIGIRSLISIHPKSSDILFLNNHGRKLSRVMIFLIIKQAVEAVGITKNVSPHTFRHSFATHLLEGGADIRQIQQMLGHESILTTEIYTHLDRSQLRRSMEMHHPLADE